MFKTFNLGFLLGIVGTGVLLLYVPVVDQYREISIINVQPNGGNSEIFQINVPRDRIFAGVQESDRLEPVDLQWPQDPMFADSQAEMFKIRNRNNIVVGLASRIVSTDIADSYVHWMLHLPARGSLFLTMGQSADDAGVREGTLQVGTREFAELSGIVTERFVSDIEANEFDINGRLELTTLLVAPMGDDRLPEEHSQ